MFCQKCGNELNDGSKFCANCGTQVGESGASDEEKSDTSYSNEQGPVEQTYYDILNIEKSADEETIKTAIKQERTKWSSRVSRGGTMGDHARHMVEAIGEAEKILLDKAKRAKYDESLKKKPKKAPHVKKGEKNWLEEVYRYYDSDDDEMAVAAVDKATTQQANNPEAWFLAANVYLKSKKYDKASYAAQQLILLDPENPSAYGIRGDVFSLQRNDPDKAIEMYKKMEAFAKDDTTKKAAQESICFTKVLTKATEAYNIYGTFPESYTINEAMMDKLSSSKSSFEKIKTSVRELYRGISNPTDWLSKSVNGVISDIDIMIKDMDTNIQRGNEVVNLPGFVSLIVGAVAVGIAGLCCFAIPYIGSFFAIVCLAAAAIWAGMAFVKYRKPAYKAADAVAKMIEQRERMLRYL